MLLLKYSKIIDSSRMKFTWSDSENKWIIWQMIHNILDQQNPFSGRSHYVVRMVWTVPMPKPASYAISSSYNEARRCRFEAILLKNSISSSPLCFERSDWSLLFIQKQMHLLPYTSWKLHFISLNLVASKSASIIYAHVLTLYGSRPFQLVSLAIAAGVLLSYYFEAIHYCTATNCISSSHSGRR